jgi:nucleoside-diphosphate-sugar epimerase
MKILITGGHGNISKIIKNNLLNFHDIDAPSHHELNMLNITELGNFIHASNYDIIIHTAILGGRRSKEDTSEMVYKNIMMMENILFFADKFKMIINLDSAAIYDRETNILNRQEDELFTIPSDYYGFSKYMIYKRSLLHNNVYNFRIFNIFHVNEEPDRFIKSCFLSKKNNAKITIYADKYFDFVSENDFISILKYYIDNCNSLNQRLEKTFNICYKEKYKLSDIANIILQNNDNINIVNNSLKNNYSGNGSRLHIMNIPLLGLINSLKLYECNFHN